ncbi:MAG: acetate--CoA ligase family protein [Promethearchaeota archaeon]
MPSDLEFFFNPTSVAVVGASEKKASVGGVIFRNFLKPSYRGVAYPVNPRVTDVLGIKCFDRITSIPNPVELAILAIPAGIVPKVMLDCEAKGVKAVIIISGGFKETGSEGADLENQVIEIAKRAGIRVIGPNCVGIYDTNTGVDTTFLPASRMGRPEKGYISFISQSGAFAAAILDWTEMAGLGVSRVISFGNKCDVNEIDLIKYLGKDPETHVIVEYLEGLTPSTGGNYLQTAKTVTRKKPIIVVKSGRSVRGSAAAASHTGALAGDARLYDYAFRQVGILVARDFEDAFDMAKTLAAQPPAAGNRILIVTDAGGAGVMTVDACAALGLEVPEPPDKLRNELARHFPSYCSVHNPIDLTGDTDAERYQTALELSFETPHYDAAIVIVMLQIPLLNLDIVDRLSSIARTYKKPIVACTAGGRFTLKGARLLEEAGIPAVPSPRRAARAIWSLVEYGRQLNQSKAKEIR